MAHFAKLDENNIVTEVLVVNNEVLLKADNTESEYKGKTFLNSLFGSATWIQTSYNGNFRKQFAAVGYKYDSTNDVFISPSPFASWVLDSNFDWQSSVFYPTDGKMYSWNEENQSWDLYTPEQPFSSWVWDEDLWRWQPPIDYPSDYGTIFYNWNEETLSWDEVGDCLDCP